jgi:LEA14-like dessication related protein
MDPYIKIDGGTIPKSNIKIVERGKIDNPNTDT